MQSLLHNFLVLSTFINLTFALQFHALARRAASVCIAATYFTAAPHDSFARNDAFEGAAKAMLETREKTTEQREFAKLPAGAKKRAALNACKDNDIRKAASMGSATECSRQVLDGNFDSLTKVLSGESPSVSTRAFLTPKEAKPAGPSSSAGVVSKKVEKSKLVKVTDLSDLPAAAKKRRALAACKKGPTRKFAGMGSETKCAESVMQGNYGPLIEALEYGQ